MVKPKCGCSGSCRCRVGGGLKPYIPHSDRTLEELKKMRESVNRLRNSRREIILKHYGGRCVCCKESIQRFLTIDHINGGGSRRRALRINQKGERPRLLGRDYYRLIIEQGFPKDLQILCYNCNCGRALNGGICPHKERRVLK